MSYNVAILAGGKSRRFGSNKALFQIDGKSLISRLISEIIKLENKPEAIFISISQDNQKNDIIKAMQEDLTFFNTSKNVLIAASNDQGNECNIPIQFVVDRPRNNDIDKRAPIFGIQSIFKEVKEGIIQFMPCDNPNFNKFFMNLLFSSLMRQGKDCAALIPRWSNGYYEPLHGIYRPELCIEKLDKILNSGDFKLIDFIESGIKVKFLKIEENLEKTDPEFKTFTNINTRVELPEK